VGYFQIIFEKPEYGLSECITKPTFTLLLA